MLHTVAVRHHATTRPDAPAVVQGDAIVGFGALQARTDHLAAALLARGVARGDRVVLWLPPCADMAAALLAVWTVGGLAVLVDPNVHETTYRHVVAKVAPRLVWHAARRPPPAELGMEEAIEAAPTAPLVHRPRDPLPQEPASILFTSGSTGMPKGVVQSHGNLARGARAVASTMALDGRDRMLCPVPWSFDYGYLNLQMTLQLGLPHFLPEIDGGPFAIAKAIDRHRPTVFVGVPAVLPFALGALRGAGGASLRAVTNTGGAIPAALLDRLIAELPRAELFLNYGLTESYRTSLLPPELVRTHRTSVGRGIPGVEVVVVDEDHRPLPAGEQGQIVHRGDYLFLGYWGDPETTATRLKPDPLALPEVPHPALALFTGDQGVIDEDGLLTFRGRADRQMKSMGVRVSPDEVEAMLRLAPFVHDAAVWGRPHDTLGHEVCAAIVVEAGHPVDDASLRAYAKTLPPHAAPRSWHVVDALPRTHSGKVDYPALQRLQEA